MRIKFPKPGATHELVTGSSDVLTFPVLPKFIHTSTAIVHEKSTFARHRHPHYEIIIVKSGIYDCQLNDHPLRLDAGDMLVVKPGDFHEDFLTPPLHYEGLVFALPAKNPDESVDFFLAGISPDKQVLPKSLDHVRSTLDRLSQVITSNDGFSMVLQNALIAIFVIDLLRLIPPDLLRMEFRPIDRIGDFEQKLTRLFSDKIGERLDTDAMAKHLGISRRSLIYQCRKELATSPAQAFSTFKVKRALVLLRDTELTIREISDYLGFDNQFHFSKVFKRVHGKAPNVTRRLVYPAIK